MNRNRFVLEEHGLVSAAEEHLAATLDARAAHREFAQRLGADDFKVFRSLTVDDGKPTVLNVVALRYDDAAAMPPGLAPSARFAGMAVPDVSTRAGRELASEMAELPFAPLAAGLASRIGAQALRVDGSVAAGIGVEMLQSEIVVSVPGAGYRPVAGMRALPEAEYQQRREQAAAEAARPHRGLRM